MIKTYTGQPFLCEMAKHHVASFSVTWFHSKIHVQTKPQRHTKGIETSKILIKATHSTQRPRKDVKDLLDWSEMEVATTFLYDVVKTSSRRRPQDVFQKMSSRHLPGNVLKTSLRRLKTSRLFLVRAKAHMETIYGLSISVRFKLLTNYHSITRQTN